MSIFTPQKQKWLIFKIIYTFVILAFLFSPVLPAKKIQADEPVIDATNAGLNIYNNGIVSTISTISSSIIGKEVTSLSVKEYILDPMFKMIARTILRNITQSIIKWAATGFQGNPSFIQDPTQFFANVADQAIGNIIYNNAGLQWMCSPFRLQLKRALIYNRSFTQRAQCTLTQVIGNYEGFINGVNNELGSLGGWNAWNVMATQPENNPYGAYALFNLQVDAAITTDKQRELNLLNWGGGFFSWEDPSCKERNRQAEELRATYEFNNESGVQGRSVTLTANQMAGFEITPGQQLDAGQGQIYYQKCDVYTPGSVIADQINSSLGAGVNELIAADEISEVLGAVLYGLVTNVLGDSGLFGAGGGGGGYVNDYESQVEQENRQAFQSTKNDTVSQINSNLNAENNYILTKNQSIARVEVSAQKERDLAICLRESATTTPITTPQLTRILLFKTPMQRDISIAENNINNLNSLGDRIDALPYERRDSFRSLVNEFANLISQVHNQGDVIQAEFERDYDLPEQLRTIDEQIARDLNLCLNPPNINSGGSTEGGAGI